MRLLLLADIHANLEALEAVLADADKRGFTDTMFLGDAVGYGVDAKAVLTRLRALSPRAVQGNHEKMLLALTRGGIASKTPVGQALKVELEQLSAEDLAWIGAWKQGVKTMHGSLECFFVHGSPRNPDEYVDSLAAARGVFTDWVGRIAFVGHTHVAGVYTALGYPPPPEPQRFGRIPGVPGATSSQVEKDSLNLRFTPFLEPINRLPMPPKGRWIVNPGSVGQPRDGIPKASYGIFDFTKNSLEVYRVDYDVYATQQKIRAAGLPEALASRLSVGK